MSISPAFALKYKVLMSFFKGRVLYSFSACYMNSSGVCWVDSKSFLWMAYVTQLNVGMGERVLKEIWVFFARIEFLKGANKVFVNMKSFLKDPKK